MSFHENLGKWQKLATVESCPVCNGASMPEGMIDLAELQASWLNAEPIECIKGACHVTSKYHGIELFDLSDDELFKLMKDVCLYSKALKNVTKAVKINYEIHGNSLPHLHVHLYPRYINDPFPGQPIDYRKKRKNIYGKGEYETFIRELRNEIERLNHIQVNALE